MDDKAANSRAHKAKEVLLHEVKQFLVMFFYLWALLGLFVLNEKVTLREHGIPFAPHGFAFINALILAKVMLIAEDLNLGARLQPRPLIYPILTEALILSVLFICFHVIEKIVVGLIAGETLAVSVPTIGGGGLIGLVCVALILFHLAHPVLCVQAREPGARSRPHEGNAAGTSHPSAQCRTTRPRLKSGACFAQFTPFVCNISCFSLVDFPASSACE